MSKLGTTWFLALITTLGSVTLCAQIPVTASASLDFDRPEAWAMKYFASVNLLTGFGPPQDLEPGGIVVGLEADSVPSLSAAERRVGFNGTKEEDINRTSIFGRPRLAVGLPRGFTVEGSYLAAIDISGVEPDLLALGLARTLATRSVRTGLRLTVQHGTFAGDFTCSANEIANGPNEFGCELPSNDEITIDSTSLEVSLARAKGAEGRLEPYVSAAVNFMDLEFQVRADYRGLNDRSRLLTSGTTLSVALGVARQGRDGWRWATELFYSPLEVVRPPSTATENDGLLNARVLLAYTVR